MTTLTHKGGRPRELDLVPEAERRRIVGLVNKHGMEPTAEELGISVPTLYYRLLRWDYEKQWVKKQGY